MKYYVSVWEVVEAHDRELKVISSMSFGKLFGNRQYFCLSEEEIQSADDQVRNILKPVKTSDNRLFYVAKGTCILRFKDSLALNFVRKNIPENRYLYQDISSLSGKILTACEPGGKSVTIGLPPKREGHYLILCQ